MLTSLTVRQRVLAFVGLVVVLALLTSGYAYTQLRSEQQQRSRPPSVARADAADRSAVEAGPHLVFRHTGLDSEYGRVAEVALDDPSGARVFTDASCDRVAATRTQVSCLATQRGVVTKFEATLTKTDGTDEGTVPLPGIPSRTRLSPDSSLVATTSFVTGHSYMTVGFSTATVIRRVGGASYGNLEKFQLVMDGREVNPTDRNIWGVTFADDRTFYATVGTGGETYLVRGDLVDRTLTQVATHVECPSLSPDGTTIAFKEASTRDGKTWWTPAVLDLATGKRTILAGETRFVDDQIAWLDDDTVMYGLPRDDAAGITDVWSLDVDAAATPQLLVEQAWSPSVVS